MTLGERLRELRGTRTQGEIAALAGLSVSGYSHFENDAREPCFRHLVMLADAFETVVPVLLAPVDCGEALRRQPLPFDEIGG